MALVYPVLRLASAATLEVAASEPCARQKQKQGAGPPLLS